MRALWAAAEPALASCFQSFEFARSWSEVYFPRGVAALVVQDAATPFLLPWAARDAVLFPIGHGLFDYADVIAAPAAAPTLVERAPALARALRRCGGWRRLEMHGLPGDSPFLAFWRRLAQELGAPAAITPFSAAPQLRRNRCLATPQALDRLHPRAAERLRAARRRGWLGPVEEEGERRAMVDWLLRQKEERMRTLGQASVLQAAEGDWLRRIATHASSGAELWAYRREQRLAAGFLTFLAPPLRYGYLLAFAPELAATSPAVTLLYFVLRETIGQGLDFDFLTGEQAFKLRFANAARPLLRLQLERTP